MKLRKQTVFELSIYLFFTFIIILLFKGFTSSMYIHFLVALSFFITIDVFLYVFLRKTILKNYKPLNRILYTFIYFMPMMAVIIASIVPYFSPYPDWNPIARSRFIGIVFVLAFTKGVFCIVYLFGITHFIIRKRFAKDLGVSFKRLFRSYITISLFICLSSILAFIIAFSYGERRIDIEKINVSIENLPSNFNNYKIVHITDLHLGSIDLNTMKRVVDIVNLQKADIICFTGDLVTYSSMEINVFKNTLKLMKAKDGIFAVLGNHDYGTYSHYKTGIEQEKEWGRIKIYISDSLQWNLLLNKSIEIKKGSSSILLGGIENMSAKKSRFISRGDIIATFKGKDTSVPVILLSHNPDIWEPYITKEYKYIDLTLSGHTHGMQYGIPLKKNKVTNLDNSFKETFGMYKSNNQFLYISKGIGSSLLHGRLGMWADISIITLKNND